MTDVDSREKTLEEQKTAYRDKIDLGTRATIAQAVLTDAMDVLEKQCFEVFSSADPNDSGGHLNCVLYMKVLKDVKKRFRDAINTGKTSTASLKHLQKEDTNAPVI